VNDRGLGLAILFFGGLSAVAFYKSQSHKPTRMAVSWRKNPDSTCTFIYDDGSEETGVCTDPPA